jgi:S-methylmethionine-dependent homocysteine/selenocysteine methylase
LTATHAIPRSSLRDRLTRGEIILLDGALGTELERRGVSTRLPLWSAQAVLDAPEHVRAIHEEYARAGADILTAATFRTTPRAVNAARAGGGATAGLDALTLTRAAIALCAEARAAVGGKEGAAREILIAGSIAPLEDCYAPDRAPDAAVAEREHAEQARRLAEAGADLLLVETMGTIREAVAAVTGAARTGLPLLVSFICRDGATLLGGDPLADAVRAVEGAGVDAILVNCTGVNAMAAGLDTLSRSTSLPIGCFPNAGSPDLASGSWRFDSTITPDRFAREGLTWVQAGAQIVGGCCGTGPAHIRALRDLLPPVLLE